MKITHYTVPGAKLNLGTTSKFKTLRIQVTFHAPLHEATVTGRAILPYLMRSISSKYPTRASMQTKLEEMYAASFGASVRKIGLAQEISFDLHIIDPQYAVESNDLLTETFEFLHEVLFQPLFDESIFRDEIRLMDEYFLGLYSNKMRYAMKELVAVMYEGEPYRLDAMGQQKDLATITLEECEAAYHNMMSSDLIHINVVGDMEETHLLDLVKQYLPFEDRIANIRILDPERSSLEQPHHLELVQDVEQAKLAIGYRLPILYLTDEYYHAVVFNALLGGGPDSILFKRIREELNKVYFIGSSYDQYKGSLFIYAGIDASDKDEVTIEIKTILSALQSGEITDEALHIAKTALIQNLVESMDSIGAITSRINHLALFHRTFDQQQLIERVQRVSKQDIVNVAKQVSLDTVVVLRGESHE